MYPGRIHARVSRYVSRVFDVCRNPHVRASISSIHERALTTSNLPDVCLSYQQYRAHQLWRRDRGQTDRCLLPLRAWGNISIVSLFRWPLGEERFRIL